jgi:type II secretory pathway component PulF
VGWQQTSQFFRQLAVLSRSGMPIVNSLRLAGDVAGGSYRRRSEEWAKGCTAGRNLADQLEQAGEPTLVCALVRAGETTGRLPELCVRIADHFDQLHALRSVAISKLIYPTLLLHAGLVLPALPGVVLGDSSPLWLLAGPAVIWVVVIALVIIGRTSHEAGLLAKLALMPGPRFVVQPFLTCNVCLVLSAAVAAGLLPRAGLELAAAACGNRVLEQRLRAAGLDIEQGRIPDLTAALRQVGLPNQIIAVIAVGEQSGTLDRTLDQAAVAARESFQTRATWSAKIFTGTIYGLVMIFAAWQVVSMYSNMMNAAAGAADEAN